MKVSLAQFSDVVASVHEAGAAPERWSETLAAIVSLVDGARGGLFDIDARSGALQGMWSVGHDPAIVKVYSEHYYAIDPTMATALSLPSNTALSVYDFFPKAVRRRHEYFDWAQKSDIGDAVGVHSPETLGTRSMLSLQRPAGAKPFGGDDKWLVQLLARHVAIAKRVQAKLGKNWTDKAEIEAAFAQLANAACILDAQLHVRHLNPAAAALLANCRRVGIRRGRLAFVEPDLHHRVHALVRDAAHESGRSAVLAFRISEHETAEILIAPLGAAHGLTSTWETPLALLVIATNQQDEGSIAWRLRQLYRLTRAESRVAAQLAMGKTVEEIAAANGVADPTLRSQLRSIFNKTGTRRQAELVRLALRGAALRQDP